MIGIFDSGAGGLTVVKEIRRLLPDYDLIYFGDTARFPYGNQSPKLLQRYASEDAALLVRQGAQLVIIGCNSAAAAAGEFLRQQLTVPVFDVIEPAVEEAARRTRHGRIGVIGTKATVKSGVYERRLQALSPHSTVIARATPMLVPLVEERWWKYPESMRMIRRSLKSLKDAHVDTLVLACTHYPLLQPLIERVMGKQVAVVNPARTTAEALRIFLVEHPDVARTLARGGHEEFYVSSDPAHFRETAEWWLGRNVEGTEMRTESE